MSENSVKKSLFIKNESLCLILVGIAGLLFAAVSAAGLLITETVYPADELLISFLPNDYINLFFGIPVLVLSAVMARKGSKKGLAAFAGSQMFMLYNEIAYVYAVHGPISTALGVAGLLFCAAALIVLLLSADKAAMKPSAGIRRPGVYAVILIVMGLVFVGRAAANLLGTAELSIAEAGVNIADIALCLIWIASGFSMLKKNGVNSAYSLISLMHGSLLFIALILFLFLQPLIAGTQFAAADIAAIGGMSLVFLIPCFMLTRKFSAK